MDFDFMDRPAQGVILFNRLWDVQFQRGQRRNDADLADDDARKLKQLLE
jgi:hypothetical protein